MNRRECSIPDCGKPSWARGYCAMHYRRWRKYGNPNTLVMTAVGLPGKFIEDAVTAETDLCILWPFAKDSAGYGKARWKGRDSSAHRIVCIEVHGLPPTCTHEAAHSCGNGHLGCVNPRHLRWATHKENHADRKLHGTNNAGERSGAAKLTEQDVMAIRAASGLTQLALARRFGVTDSTIRKVLSGETWRHL